MILHSIQNQYPNAKIVALAVSLGGCVCVCVCVCMFLCSLLLLPPPPTHPLLPHPSSMQMIHYLHETGDRSVVSVAMVISTVWDSFRSQRVLEHKLINRSIYIRFLVTRMKQMIRR